MEKIVVIGSSGFVGTHVTEYLSKNSQYDTKLGFFKNKPKEAANSVYIDITDREKTEDTILKLNPDIILHLAAEANVDKSEIHQHNTYLVNTKGTKNIVDSAKKINAKVIMTSTDYVFEGKKEIIYKESSKKHPVNIEGDSKARAEEVLISSRLESWAICRISVPYGWRKFEYQKSFLDWVVTSCSKGEEISLVSDQYNCPTSLNELSLYIYEIIRQDGHGTYHTVGPEYLSRYEFGLIIADVFDLEKKLIAPITTEELIKRIPSYKAPRPFYCNLEDTRLEKELSVNKKSIKENLEILKNQK
ncbi:MAG: dTDP-4-dehydrorhamnose reductase [Candidatus Heimdallarchaeota archaeon LC_3]|nr:MAG: dTDP-4-dehydrorhamnose reductase [Candidatus Heimdallarchaeota archaeon LC_3]